MTTHQRNIEQSSYRREQGPASTRTNPGIPSVDLSCQRGPGSSCCFGRRNVSARCQRGQRGGAGRRRGPRCAAGIRAGPDRSSIASLTALEPDAWLARIDAAVLDGSRHGPSSCRRVVSGNSTRLLTPHRGRRESTGAAASFGCLVSSGPGQPLARRPCRSRKDVGDIPCIRVNTREKWKGSSKPARAATCFTNRSVLISRSTARFTRSLSSRW